MIALKASFISSGKKDRSINSNHLSFAFANLAKMLLITFSSNPDACIEATKSAFLILRFFAVKGQRQLFKRYVIDWINRRYSINTRYLSFIVSAPL